MRFDGRGSSGSELSNDARFEVFLGSTGAALTGNCDAGAAGTELGRNPTVFGGDGIGPGCIVGCRGGGADVANEGDPSIFLRML